MEIIDKKDELKKLIIDAIKSNPSAKKMFDALKTGRPGEILKCYKETVDKDASQFNSPSKE